MTMSELLKSLGVFAVIALVGLIVWGAATAGTAKKEEQQKPSPGLTHRAGTPAPTPEPAPAAPAPAPTPPPKATYTATLVDHYPVNPATLRFFFDVTNT